MIEEYRRWGLTLVINFANSSNMERQLLPSEEPPMFHPYTKDVNQRLVQPTYQKYVAGEPRFFPPELKAIGLARQDFICPICGGGIDMHHSECHHMISFSYDYGNTSLENLLVVHRGRCHRIADEMSQRGDLIVGGTIYDAEPSQFRAGHKPPMYTKPPSL